MAWGNMEVESVELVQDMSYEKLKERLDRAIQKGEDEVKEELFRNFDIAVKAVEKKLDNTNECIMQCDESFRILLSILFLTLDIVKRVSVYLEHSVLVTICVGFGKSSQTRNLSIMVKKCCTEIKDEIEFLEEFGDSELQKDVIRLKTLTEGVGGKSVFQAFVDSIFTLINCAENSIKSQYGISGNVEFEDAVIRAIYLYVDRENNEYHSSRGKTWERILNQALCKGIDMYNSKYNAQIMTTPFTYALNKIMEQ